MNKFRSNFSRLVAFYVHYQFVLVWSVDFKDQITLLFRYFLSNGIWIANNSANTAIESVIVLENKWFEIEGFNLVLKRVLKSMLDGKLDAEVVKKEYVRIPVIVAIMPIQTGLEINGL